MTDKTIDWYIQLVRGSYMTPHYVAHRRLTGEDRRFLSDFMTRLEAAGKAAGIAVSKTDFTKPYGDGSWVFNPYAVVVFIQNNIALLRRISAFREVVLWYDAMLEYINRHNEISDAQWMTAEEKIAAQRVLWDRYQPELSFFVSSAQGE